MYVAAAEGDGDMINGRGDVYCGMLNCSYNLGMRGIRVYIPEYPVGTGAEIARMMVEFLPIARAILGFGGLKVITFGPRPQDFFACNAPIKGFYELGVEIKENSELDLLVAYNAHKGVRDYVAFAHCGKALLEVFMYLGVGEIGYSRRAALPYSKGNPFE